MNRFDDCVQCAIVDILRFVRMQRIVCCCNRSPCSVHGCLVADSPPHTEADTIRSAENFYSKFA